jgi:NAD(P)-dependent dehydrogenase (short-subunit alcohol dehydrogenase family)
MPVEKNERPSVALVTGAGSGIGAATAKRLASDGMKVALLDINAEGLRRTADAIKGEVLTLQVNIADSAAVDAAVDKVVDRLGTLDAVAHIAGLTTQPEVKKRVGEVLAAAGDGPAGLRTTLELTNEQWSEVMRVNLDGSFYVTRAALRHMIPQRRGALVLTSSMAGVSGFAGSPHYSASKAGVIAFVQSVSREVIGFDIRVNGVAPGPVATPMRQSGPTSWQRRFPLPIGRDAQPEELASVIAFLLSDDASYIIGETINVNGGALAV